MRKEDLIYDWNTEGITLDSIKKKVELDDETLRDGLQSPSIVMPTVEQKVELLYLMEDLGIDSADIGLPGAGGRVVADVTVLAGEIARNKLNIKGSCAARTVKADIDPIIEISEKVGMPLCVDMFIGSSNIRKYVEDWSIETMLKHTTDCVKYAVNHGLPVMYVTEDTTRAHPETIRQLFTAAIESGAERVCVCDTVGHSTIYGIWNLLKFVKEVVNETGAKVKVDFHGHNDRGLALINTITAVKAGADRVHGCGLGVGERSGNAPMELLLVNLKLLEWIDNNLTSLSDYCDAVSRYVNIPVACNYPVFGGDAFRTATGVHSSAVIKAFKKEEDSWLADYVYSGVPASMVARKQLIEIGPMSGKSNVIYWLKERGIPYDDCYVDIILAKAKTVDRVLTGEQIEQLIGVPAL